MCIRDSSYYNAERMLVDDVALKTARIALATAVQQIIRNGLAILGVSCPESMKTLNPRDIHES